MTKNTPKILLIFILISQLLGCGGGGGGGGSDGTVGNEPAQVRINAEPTKFDSGDQTTATIQVSDVNPNGILLKIRTPLLLPFVIDSGTFTIDGMVVPRGPDIITKDTTYNYLVYFLGRDFFGENNFAELILSFEGNGAIAAGAIEVDADADAPLIPNDTEFTVADPKFSAADKVKVVVKG